MSEITPFAAGRVMRFQDGLLRKTDYQLRSVPAERGSMGGAKKESGTRTEVV